MTTFAGLAAISVLQTQDVDEYEIAYGALAARDIILRSRSVSSAQLPHQGAGQHAFPAMHEEASSQNEAAESQPEVLGSAWTSRAVDGGQDPLRTPRQEYVHSDDDSFQTFFLPIWEENEVTQHNTAPFMDISGNSGMTRQADTSSVSLSHPSRGPPPPATSDSQKFLELLGRQFRPNIIDLGDTEFVVEDCAVTIVRGTRVYVLRYPNERKYVDAQALEWILDKSTAVHRTM